MAAVVVLSGKAPVASLIRCISSAAPPPGWMGSAGSSPFVPDVRAAAAMLSDGTVADDLYGKQE